MKRAVVMICGLIAVLFGFIGVTDVPPALSKPDWLGPATAYVGIAAIGAALLPNKLFHRIRPDGERFSTVLLIAFAAVGFLLGIIAGHAPINHASRILVYILCPARQGPDELSVFEATYAVAPWNAAIFTAMGGIVGATDRAMRG